MPHHPMSPQELRETLKLIGWSQHSCAEYLGIDSRSIKNNWASGDKPIPQNLADWLRVLAAFHRQHPYPHDWRFQTDKPQRDRATRSAA